MRVTIEKLAYGGDGVARPAPDQPVVFVPRAAPGDELEVEIVEDKPRFRRAAILKILVPGPDRVDATCGHYAGASEAASCGGCHYQHLRHGGQLAAKHAHVREALERIGGMTLSPDVPPMPAKIEHEPVGYRNKGTFHWNEAAGTFGFVAVDGHTILPVAQCPLLAPPVADAYAAVSAVASQLARDDEGIRKSFLSLVVRAGIATGETLAALVVKPGAPKDLGERFADAVWKKRQLDSLLLNVNPSPQRALFGEKLELLAGKPTIREKIGSLLFSVDAETFLQVNTAQAKRLVDHAVRMAGAAGKPKKILDLYAGNGGLSLPLAAAFPDAEVIAVETVAPAIARGRESAALNGITNVRWRVGRVETTVKKLLHAEKLKPDVVVVDPPRAGLKEGIHAVIARLAPPVLVYVSCNPTTLARDVKQLAALGYEASPQRLEVVDLFPQTFHVETVMGLHRKERA